MAGYTRQSAADIVNGEVVKAPPLNAEFNQIESAFNASTGHAHDGTSAEGAYVPLISDTNAYTKVLVDEANAEVEFYINVGSAAVQQIGLIDGVLQPTTTNDVDLGTSSLKFKDIHIAGTANLPTVDIDAGSIDGVTIGANSAAPATFTNLTATGTTTLTSVDINGGAIDGVTIGGASPGAGTFSSLVATTADINSGTIDGTTIGASSPSTGAFTTASTSGELTAASATVSDLTSGRIVLAGTSGSLTDSATLTYTAGTPSASTDVATKGYVDNISVVDALPIVGGDAGKYLVVNGTETGVTSQVLDISDDTTPTLGGQLDANNNKIVNLTNPTNAQDAATKAYVDALPSAGQITATADQAITAGDLLGIQTDGTVRSASVGAAGTDYNGTYSTSLSGSYSQTLGVCYDTTNNKVVMAYTDGSNGYAVVGTVSSDGTTSWGTPVTFHSGGCYGIYTEYSPTHDRVLITYYRTSDNQPVGIAGQVSGTSITFGTANSWYGAASHGATSSYTAIAVSSGGAITFMWNVSSPDTRMVAVTLSGSTLSFSSTAALRSGKQTAYLDAASDNTSHIAVFFNSTDTELETVHITPGTPTAATPVSVHTSATHCKVVYDSANSKFVYIYSDGTNGLARVGSVSGTVISLGTEAQFSTGDGPTYISAVYDATSGKIIVWYRSTTGSGDWYRTEGTVSGTNITFSTPEEVNTSALTWAHGTYDPDNSMAISYHGDASATIHWNAYQPSVTTYPAYDNFIGIAEGSVADTASATVNTIGAVDSNQSGLTVGSKYYVSTTGTLTTTNTGIYVGKAISATSILIGAPG